ncbi:hypothetical protein V5O48_005817 [Marasmius crinis-equi]|uniref:Protein YOP1 n=1 Tax=Marasmius crinis-equi TaxID=585013 RepID=A0ABR3FLE2_9AGAR
MGLFVPILRLCLLFFNVYGTFKTLKPPRASSRSRTGLPSQTSILQRKRDMKGCLAIWVVWCCLAIYERHFERIISLFIPFYDEFKSIILLFMIMTRAKGAEPIFLHVLRPLLRPYTGTIDMILDIFRMVGDIIFALLTFFTRSVLDMSQSAHQRLPARLQMLSPFTYFSISLPLPHDPYTIHNPSSGTATQTAEHPVYQAAQYPPVSANGNGLSSYPYQTPNVEGLPLQDFNSIYTPAQPLQDFNSIYTPANFLNPVELPLQSDSPNDPDGHHHRPSPSLQPQHPSPQHSPGLPRENAWQWDWDARQYPGFPSAYPPTPVTHNSHLPSGRGGKGKMKLNRDPWRGPDGTVLEELPEEEAGPSRNLAENQQGFHQSLLPPRKPLNPGFEIRGSSDDLRGGFLINQSNLVRPSHGLGRVAGRSDEIIHEEEDSESDAGDVERDRAALAGVGAHEDMDVDLGEGGFNSDSEVDSDGSFNVTLQTPRAPLPPSGSATSIMTLKSTIRTRASARSLFVSGSAVYPSPVSMIGDNVSRQVGNIEEDGDEGNGKNGLSSRSSSRSRVTGLTTTKDNESTHTLSSGPASEESSVLGSSPSVSVSSLEAAMEADRESEQDEVRVGQKRRHDTFLTGAGAGSSSGHGTVRARQAGRLARTKHDREAERLTTEDEGGSSRSSSRGRPAASLQPRPKLPGKGTKLPAPRLGVSSSNTLPVRKRRKVGDASSQPSDTNESEASVPSKPAKGGRVIGEKPPARVAPPTAATRPKRPVPQRSAGPKSGTSTTQPKATTAIRSSSRLRKGDTDETFVAIQP